jgi:hypothetical protein
MAVEPAVLAPVLSAPALPAPLTARKRAALSLDPADLAIVQDRTQRGLCLLGLRFTCHKGSPGEPFATLRRVFGAAFEDIEIDSSPGNQPGIPTRAHAVLTVELVDEPGHPTRAALDRVMEFLHERLHPPPRERQRSQGRPLTDRCRDPRRDLPMLLTIVVAPA